MFNLRKALITLGYNNPELRDDLTVILKHIDQSNPVVTSSTVGTFAVSDYLKSTFGVIVSHRLAEDLILSNPELEKDLSRSDRSDTYQRDLILKTAAQFFLGRGTKVPTLSAREEERTLFVELIRQAAKNRGAKLSPNYSF